MITSFQQIAFMDQETGECGDDDGITAMEKARGSIGS
jgi:hypothetical protein